MAAQAENISSSSFEELISSTLKESQSVLAVSHQKILSLAAENEQAMRRLRKEVEKLKAENVGLREKTAEWDDFWETFTVTSKEETGISDVLASSSPSLMRVAQSKVPSYSLPSDPVPVATHDSQKQVEALELLPEQPQSRRGGAQMIQTPRTPQAASTMVQCIMDQHDDIVLQEQLPVPVSPTSVSPTTEAHDNGLLATTPRARCDDHAIAAVKSAEASDWQKCPAIGKSSVPGRPSALSKVRSIFVNESNNTSPRRPLKSVNSVTASVSSVAVISHSGHREDDNERVSALTMLPMRLTKERDEGLNAFLSEMSDENDIVGGGGKPRLSRASCHSTLSQVEPHGSHEVAQVWLQAKGHAPTQIHMQHQKTQQSLSRRLNKNAVDATMEHLRIAEAAGYLNDKPSWWLIHPHSAKRLTWDVVSLLLVWYDLVFIPLQFFEPPNLHFMLVMTWITRVFWTLDIGASCISGFVRNDGAVELRFPKIFRKYASSWLCLDVFLVLVDWSEVLVGNPEGSGADDMGGYARLGKATRIFRMIRMTRLLRLARIRFIFKNITERLHSEKLIILTDILKIVIVISGVAHLVACFWWGISIDKDDRVSWVYVNGYKEKALWYRYTTSLHWSLSQFAGGMDEITPKCLEERTYAICAFMLSFVMAAVSISAITSSMTQLHIIGSTQSQQLSVLRRYLARNGISNTLSMRVQRNAKHAMLEQQRFMSEGNVEMLRLVSEPLRAELHFETYSPILGFHPFLRKYIEECPQVMRKVCHFAVSLSLLSPGDILFSAGELPAQPKMYIVCDGLLSYSSLSGNKQYVGEGTCIAEATLWTDWCHRGVLSAVSECRLLMLDAQSFQGIATRFEQSLALDPLQYASSFVERLNAPGSSVDDITKPDLIGRRISQTQHIGHLRMGRSLSALAGSNQF